MINSPLSKQRVVSVSSTPEAHTIQYLRKMTPNSFAVLLVCLVSFSASLAYGPGSVPIPRTYDGFALGPASAPLLVEAFYDLQCPDSRAAHPVLRTVFETICSRSNTPQGCVRLIVHMFPLPYHRAAFPAAQIAQVIAENSTQLLWRWMDAYFNEQDKFKNGAIHHLSEEELHAQMVELAESSVNLPKRLLSSGLAYGNEYDAKTRVSWKYACSRGISGTPQFLVNGVLVQMDGDASVSDWESLLLPLLAQKSQPHHSHQASSERII